MPSNHSAATPFSGRPTPYRVELAGGPDTYLRAHPGMTATLFGQAEAVQAAGQAFGGLLDPPHPQESAP